MTREQWLHNVVIKSEDTVEELKSKIEHLQENKHLVVIITEYDPPITNLSLSRHVLDCKQGRWADPNGKPYINKYI